MTTQQKPQFQCRKCGSYEAKVHLREVTVTAGWSQSQFKSAAPCNMCAQCGDLTCPVEINIGKFLNLVPGANPPPPGERQASPSVQPASEPALAQAPVEEAPAGFQTAAESPPGRVVPIAMQRMLEESRRKEPAGYEQAAPMSAAPSAE